MASVCTVVIQFATELTIAATTQMKSEIAVSVSVYILCKLFILQLI